MPYLTEPLRKDNLRSSYEADIKKKVPFPFFDVAMLHSKIHTLVIATKEKVITLRKMFAYCITEITSKMNFANNRLTNLRIFQ